MARYGAFPRDGSITERFSMARYEASKVVVIYEAGIEVT